MISIFTYLNNDELQSLKCIFVPLNFLTNPLQSLCGGKEFVHVDSEQSAFNLRVFVYKKFICHSIANVHFDSSSVVKIQRLLLSQSEGFLPAVKGL